MILLHDTAFDFRRDFDNSAMIKNILTKIFGSRNERLLKRLRKTVEQINHLESQISALSDDALQAKTNEFRQRYQNGETLDQLLPEAFAVVREAGKRFLNMRHFDVQLVGAMVLHQGKISEMRTGEGKTLVATLAVYLNAISGKGVHVVTVNDYLAQRDSAWMGILYNALGMSVGVIISELNQDNRRAAYACDITYGTNNEFGFDYLRDNMTFNPQDRVQRELNYAIVDEVDSILIDEARTPLIISGPAEDSSELYKKINLIIPKLTRQERLPEKDEPELPGDYGVDEKHRQVFLSEEGHQHVEEMLTEMGLLAEGASLYDASNIVMMHHVHAALRAHVLFHRNVDYIVKDSQIIIVDEFTGRTMPGRRWSDGLHQAVEAKEGVNIQNENQTLASITFQNYFRMYKKLAGMTGTADTEAYEFQQIYNLEVVVIPTHRSMVRKDHGDLVYLTAREKYNAILEDIKDCVKRGQPALVGTVSIENSELLSNMLKKENIPHQVLNAKFHEQEAHIITQAGRPGTVTIATNMAGRGTDIILGGNVEAEIKGLENPSEELLLELRNAWKQRHQTVLDAGGLHVIGTERHESRRIDNQLRGRSGRQGDNGSSRFYLSLEDSLMRIFASERVSGMMQKLGMEEGEAIEHPWVTRAIENAQRKVEGRNFDMRKQLLEYDDVANDQRKVIYEQRNEIMDAQSIEAIIDAVRNNVINKIIDTFIPPNSPDEMWKIKELEETLEKEFLNPMPISKWLAEDHHLHEETLRQKIEQEIKTTYEQQAERLGVENVRHYEKAVMLQVLDQHWKEHLAAMDYLRQSIHLRAYGQKNPKQEYKREAFEMFQELLEDVKAQVIQVVTQEVFKAYDTQLANDLQTIQAQLQQKTPMQFIHHSTTAMAEELSPEQLAAQTALAHKKPPVQQPYVRDSKKVGRNDPCPCGSGKKYKQCHGKLD